MSIVIAINVFVYYKHNTCTYQRFTIKCLFFLVIHNWNVKPLTSLPVGIMLSNLFAFLLHFHCTHLFVVNKSVNILVT